MESTYLEFWSLMKDCTAKQVLRWESCCTEWHWCRIYSVTFINKDKMLIWCVIAWFFWCNIFQCYMIRGFSSSVIKSHDTILISLCLPPSCSLYRHRDNERNFNELLCKGSENLPALCSPKPICHAYFIRHACITFDYSLISNSFNVFCHSSCSPKSYLHIRRFNIHV